MFQASNKTGNNKRQSFVIMEMCWREKKKQCLKSR